MVVPRTLRTVLQRFFRWWHPGCDDTIRKVLDFGSRKSTVTSFSVSKFARKEEMQVNQINHMVHVVNSMLIIMMIFLLILHNRCA